MKFICKHCARKDSYRITRAAYDDMEYIGTHTITCKTCGQTFDVKFDGHSIKVVK